MQFKYGNFHHLTDRSFWQKFSPNLHVVDKDFMNNIDIFASNEKWSSYKKRLQYEGYFQTPKCNWNLPIDDMAKVISKMYYLNIMPIFAFLYDEFWLLFYKNHCLYQELLDMNYHMLPDFWCWYIDPQKEAKGWSPHRDKGPHSLFADGSPKSITTWIPLTNATTLNGCMYILPKHLDKNLHTIVNTQNMIFDHADIRALPALAGSVLMWNQCVFHWGSRASRLATEPRISVAFEFQRSDIEPYNEYLLEPMVNYSFEQRLSLIGKQILQYTHMYPLEQDFEQFARSIRSKVISF